MVSEIIKKAVANIPTKIRPYFDFGLYADVSKRVYKSKTSDPILWLVTSSIEIERGIIGIYGKATFDLIIAVQTKPEYNGQERLDKSFTPSLYPIYEALLISIGNLSEVGMPKVIKHRLIERPYWGGAEQGQDTKNLFQDYVDALQLSRIQLDIKNSNCTKTP